MLHRRSIRLKNFDYSRPGSYFVTIRTYNKQNIFGEIISGKMVLSEEGEWAKTCWLAIPDHYPDVILDEWVIMPDHIHGIIRIKESIDKNISPVRVPQVGVQHFEPQPEEPQPGKKYTQQNRYQHIIPRSLGSIVRGFKIGVTKWFRERNPGMQVWQRNYYERIIRDEDELVRIRYYIKMNPVRFKTKIN